MGYLSMGVISQSFRLTNEPGGLGLSCTAYGLSLAGVSLLRKDDAGFASRSISEVEHLIGAAYGPGFEITKLLPYLHSIASALNRGEISHAMTAAVLTKLPELTWDAAVRLTNADCHLTKYDPTQPRDRAGRWTADGLGADGTLDIREDETDDRLDDLDTLETEESENDKNAPSNAKASPLEQKYDDLGPTEFAKQVIQFGDRLGRQGKELSPSEQQDALAEYNFLQSRLTFWLGHDYKPENAQANFLSAAQTLYEGAVIGGIVPVGGKHGDPPQSMVMVAVASMALDNGPPSGASRHPSSGSIAEELRTPSRTELPEAPGGIILNSKVKMTWDGSIEDRLQFEAYNDENNPQTRRLPGNSKVFDHFNDATGDAISDKTLNTLTFNNITNPGKVYYDIRGYINETVNYQPRTNIDLHPSVIKSKTIHLGIPEYTSPMQWRYLTRAVRYGRDHNISVIITRIRD